MLLLLLAAGANLAQYFEFQKLFLTAYAGDQRHPTFAFLAVWVVATGVILLPAVPSLRVARARQPAAIALGVMTLFGSIAVALSGQYYVHYLYAITAPAALFLLTLGRRRDRACDLAGLGALGGAALCMIYAALIIATGRATPPDLHEYYADLRETVRGRVVMSVRASIVPFYYSGGEPFQPIVFAGHAKMMFGPAADGYLSERVAEYPPFVLTNFGVCDTVEAVKETCAFLKDHYDLIQRKSSAAGPWNRYAVGYDLYERGPFRN